MDSLDKLRWRMRQEKLAKSAVSTKETHRRLSDSKQGTNVTIVSPDANERLRHFSKPVVVDADGLLLADFPPREVLLSPWMLSQSLSMIYGPRGSGKTHVALGLAYALASGGTFLGWQADKAVPVLYLDGEMPGADLRDRLAAITNSAAHKPEPNFLQFMTPDLQREGNMPNLFTPAGQSAVTAVAESARVIIVDNLSALVRGGKENEGESWQPVAAWALRMRSSGRSVVFIHHAGKGGQQRGTSKREDLLDTVIALRRPSDYSPDQGARFEIHFEKSRALYGEDVTPVEAMLVKDPVGKQRWELKQVAEASETQMMELAELGLSARDIAAEIGISHSTVARKLGAARKEGRLKAEKCKPGRPRSGEADKHRAAKDGENKR